MQGLIVILGFGSLVLLGKLIQGNHQLNHRLDQVRKELLQVPIAIQANEKRKEEIKDKREFVEKIGKTVESGATSAEAIHKAISDISFDVLGSISATRGASKVVKDIHNMTTDTIYSSVKTISKQLFEIADEVLKFEEKYPKAPKPSDKKEEVPPKEKNKK